MPSTNGAKLPAPVPSKVQRAVPKVLVLRRPESKQEKENPDEPSRVVQKRRDQKRQRKRRRRERNRKGAPALMASRLKAKSTQDLRIWPASLTLRLLLVA